jgi:AAA domain
VFAIIVDSDADKEMGWTPTVPVSMTIATSPGNFQYWFFLREAVNAETGKKLGERIRKAVNSDHATGNVVQPYRVAGTVNYPNRNKIERGRVTVPTQLIKFDPEVLWTPEQIEAAFPLVERKTNGGDTASANGRNDEGDIPADTMRAIREGVDKADDRSGVFFNVVLVLKRLGWTVDGITPLLETYPDGIAKKYYGRLWQEVERVYGKIKIDGGAQPPEAAGADDNGNDNAPRRQERFKLVPFDQIQPGRNSGYLIKDVIPRTGIVVTWGPPKCGKSFWTFDLVMHCALSRTEYRGYRVVGGPVVYCAFEGQEGFKARVEAFRREHEISGPVSFFLIASDAKLVRDHRALINDIRDQIGDTAPVAVVLDTLNRSIDGSESKDQDMGAYLDAASAIQRAFECVVLIVHHCGVDGTRPRGHTSITGTCEAQIAVSRDAADNVVVEVEYMKDGPAGARFTSKLKVVDVGYNEDGDLLTSCVITAMDESELPARPKKIKLTPAATIARRALSEAILKEGQNPPAAAPAPLGSKGVEIKVWREQAYRRGISAGETERAKQLAFKRACAQLLALSQVGVWEEFVWMP